MLKPKINKYNILRQTKTGYITLGGEAVGAEKLKKLVGEIGTLKSLEMWEIFQDTIRQYAVDMGFDKALTFEDMLAGKMLWYAIEVMKLTVDKIELLGKKLEESYKVK